MVHKYNFKPETPCKGFSIKQSNDSVPHSWKVIIFLINHIDLISDLVTQAPITKKWIKTMATWTSQMS
jgi:hypothetical protein